MTKIIPMSYALAYVSSMTAPSTLTFGMILPDDTLAVLLGDGFAETSVPRSAPLEINRAKRAVERGSGFEKAFLVVVGLMLAGVLISVWSVVDGVLM